ncbi:MAG: UPF0280 family protein, partial [Actinobacteria bacterium]|nr:UPF0280 family protein [Actinomycetota bacterium]
DVTIDVFLKNKCFRDRVKLLIKSGHTPCGVCSSSGSFGHSLSLGKSDLVTVLSASPIAADGAATAIANRISTPNDIKPTIDCFKKLDELKGILIIKDDKLGIWGNLELIM